ncbi:MAG: 2,3-bisphosphoglycerate-independent phosphoglycerate mutase [Proteobacteria bacterium]|nr:2,3-bisphosphoglycerate-independent phosphoglycerate mutase [Pseudomonadota bacterium]
MSKSHPRPVVLCVLDGWGHRAEPAADDAIAAARTPNLKRLSRRFPMAYLDASALEVGLPKGQMGNSEVGHMNLGAGRVVMQELPRIDAAVADGRLARLPALGDFIATLKAGGGACHLMGLISPGGVHSHQSHIAALARTLATAGIPVRVHAFLDGRDTPPASAKAYLMEFQREIAGCKDARIATVAGRFYAMDRDQRWERVKEAYSCLVEAAGVGAASAEAALSAAYAKGETDEFVTPVAIDAYPGMKDGDGLLMANFRADRVREILSSLIDPAFSGFPRARVVRFAAALGMTEYSSMLARLMATLFQPSELTHTLGELVAEAGLRQLRIAETEKYAHVTFFFNGGEEREFKGEDRILVPSPKVKTYDEKPEMSAYEVTDKLVAAIDAGTYDLIVVNYANTDMVGHTGDMAAAVKAVEAVDACIGRLADALERAGGAILITADHGNAEQMRDPETGEKHTAHTTNKVPVMLIGAGDGMLADGRLADVAPTLLQVMGLQQPVEMTGRSLIRPNVRAAQKQRASA